MGDGSPWLNSFNGMVADMWNDFAGWAKDTPEPESDEYAGRKRAFTMGAAMMKKRATLMLLEDIAKRRPLDDHESALMAQTAARMARHKRQLWRWTPAEDAKLMRLVRKRERNGRPKPYQPNGEVARLADELGRSYMAVHRRMERLRKAAALINCSNARTGGEG